MNKHPSVFLVSSGRSGSTLLQSILNASQQIYIPQESDFITRAYPFYYDHPVYTDDDYEQLANFFCLTTVKNWGLTRNDIAASLKKAKPQTFGEVIALISSNCHQSEGTQDLVWGIKRPVLIARLNRIISVYPDAKIVHVCRDGRDVFLSYQSVHKNSSVKFGPKGIVANVLYWVDSLRRIEAFNCDCIFEIKYEELISHPEQTLPALFDFLNLSYNPSFIEEFKNYEKNKEIVPKVFQKDTHNKLSETLDASNSQKYKRKMSKAQILCFEILASPYLVKYGYPIEFNFSTSPLFSPLRRSFYCLARHINNIRYSLRDQKTYANSRIKG
ncbi:MAG: sulfotransferase [Limnothrix sp. RL_2_0]|nr:sulfotransferase [Limnothrix sp. RL_2_0]